MSNNLAKVTDIVETTFLTMTKAAFGENLKAVILYGSVVKGGFVEGVSDVNVMIILDVAAPAAVVALGKNARSIINKNRINPLLLTDEEFLGSADVFPMEYLDLLESRKVLFGEDLPSQLTITTGNLRHQVEEQIRGSIASVRRALLGTAGKESAMKNILKEWFGAQSALLRALLRLKDVKVSGDIDEYISQLGSTFSIDVGGLKDAARLRRGEPVGAIDTAERVLICLTELAAQVDEMDG